MLDFAELDATGTQFELLLRELLFSRGYHVVWSGVGADAGRDLVCIEEHKSIFGLHRLKWLIQCKHFAHSARSVGLADLDSVIDSCSQHEADGYILACSTRPSAAVVARLEAVSRQNGLRTGYWDAATIERLISTPESWHIAQRFFPASASGWHVSRTTEPNRWVVNFKGHHFYLSNRIGSKAEGHFRSSEECKTQP